MDAAGPAGLDRFAPAIREAGLRATRPRLLVLDLLDAMDGHRSVDELVASLAEQGTPLPRTSVYNVVNDLSAAGLIMAADAGPGRALYEAGGEWHHHFVCRRCQGVIDVPCVNGQRPCLELSVPGVRVEEAQVIFRGICEECTAAPIS